ncbi:MAG: metalloregulator ArsR/SmtB family transcription factor [Thermoanaerobaculia bacterium]|nr:metalloregulator ArsR/SmtB family transcription factor [Thermoanaerobaculia bacterium]
MPIKRNLERLFQALADGTRLRLLNLLAEGELCVCYFVEILGEPQPKISRHLAYLRRAGLVETRRDGKWIHYRIGELESSALGETLEQILGILKLDPQMQRDLRALRTACCAVRLPPSIADAPRPVLANPGSRAS